MSQSTASFHSQRSSRRASPTSSVRQIGENVSVETLISYLVAAKRSLSSIHHVHRATTLLTEARSTIEATAALVARTKYLRRSLNSQLKILRSVQYELEANAHAVKQEIHATTKELESADHQLQTNINLLRQTRIEDGFKGPKPRDENGEEVMVDLKNALHDFVDDQPVEALRHTAHSTHTTVKEARATIDLSIRNLEDELQQVNQALAEKTATSSSTKSDLHPVNVPRQLRLLERNAHDMAQSLESLVQHFDSCVNAIKHTEGAGAAVVKNFTTEDLPDGVDVETFQGPTESMSDEERTEMLAVLKTDAEQVDEVVNDIQERAAEMDLQLDRIIAWRESCNIAYQDIASAFKMLQAIGDRLPARLHEIAQFARLWLDEKHKIEDCAAGMEELCDMYDNFLTAYDGMIVEAARRKGVRKRMEKIAQDAQKQLDDLFQDDLAEREHFRTEQGAYLPSDIWHGLDVPPAQYSFQRMNEEGPDSIPDLPKETVSGALKRLKAAQAMNEPEER